MALPLPRPVHERVVIVALSSCRRSAVASGRLQAERALTMVRSEKRDTDVLARWGSRLPTRVQVLVDTTPGNGLTRGSPTPTPRALAVAKVSLPNAGRLPRPTSLSDLRETGGQPQDMQPVHADEGAGSALKQVTRGGEGAGALAEADERARSAEARAAELELELETLRQRTAAPPAEPAELSPRRKILEGQLLSAEEWRQLRESAEAAPEAGAEAEAERSNAHSQAEHPSAHFDRWIQGRIESTIRSARSALEARAIATNAAASAPSFAGGSSTMRPGRDGLEGRAMAPAKAASTGGGLAASAEPPEGASGPASLGSGGSLGTADVPVIHFANWVRARRASDPENAHAHFASWLHSCLARRQEAERGEASSAGAAAEGSAALLSTSSDADEHAIDGPMTPVPVLKRFTSDRRIDAGFAARETARSVVASSTRLATGLAADPLAPVASFGSDDSPAMLRSLSHPLASATGRAALDAARMAARNSATGAPRADESDGVLSGAERLAVERGSTPLAMLLSQLHAATGSATPPSARAKLAFLRTLVDAPDGPQMVHGMLTASLYDLASSLVSSLRVALAPSAN